MIFGLVTLYVVLEDEAWLYASKNKNVVRHIQHTIYLMNVHVQSKMSVMIRPDFARQHT